jgi:hypothetical protein
MVLPDDAYFANNPMNDRFKRICGAQNRQGKPCQVAPMLGKERCRLHGGKTPKGKHTGPMTHGLYSKSMSPAEREVWNDISLDSLDDEIRMCRIWLARAGEMDYQTSQNPHDPKDMTGFELVEIRRTTGGGKTSTDAVSKRPDLWARKDRLLGRLAHLVKTRAELIAQAQAAGEGAGDVARDLVDTLRAMKRTEFEQKPPPPPTTVSEPAPEPDADV